MITEHLEELMYLTQNVILLYSIIFINLENILASTILHLVVCARVLNNKIQKQQNYQPHKVVSAQTTLDGIITSN